MKNKILILSIFASIAGGCGQSNTGAKKDNHTDNDNMFLGKWHSVERIAPFGATLEIDSNNNFIYAGGACDSRFGSKGDWLLNGDTLILNSFYPKDCYYIFEFGVGRNMPPLNDEFGNPLGYEPITSIEDCKPNTDSTYYFFINEKFIIKDSVLTHIQKPDAFPHTKEKDNFTRTKWWIGN